MSVRKGAEDESNEEDTEQTPVRKCFGEIVLRVAPREFTEES